MIPPPPGATIGKPDPYPVDVLLAFTFVFQRAPAIEAAHLGQAAFPGRPPHLVVALSSAESWDKRDAGYRPHAMRKALPSGRAVEFTPLPGGMFEEYFRTEAQPFFKKRDRQLKGPDQMAPRVLISDALSPAAVQIFKDRGIEVDFQPNLGKDKDKLAEVVGNFDGLAIRSATKVSPKILEKAKNLKVIGRAGIGVDNVDIPAATARGVIVMNTPFGNSITTAEHAISLMLALARQIPEADTSTRAGKWEKNKFMGVEIFGKTLGVIGCGNIGSIVADRGVGLRMKVIAYDPFLSPERALELGVEKVDLDELFHRADFITLHTPLTEKTKNIIDAAALKKMRKGVRIVNCARGGLVDEAALAEALKSGHVAGAAFDVFVEEPATANPLFCCPTWSARRISAPPPPRRRRTSRCRSPSRCRTICCAARSPTP